MPLESLPAACISRLTRLLDLNLLEQIQELEDQGYVTQNVEIESTDDDHHDGEHGRRKSITKHEDKRSNVRKVKKMFRLSTGRVHSSQVFGTHLNESAIETIVTLLDHLKKYSDVEGLFRISGNKRRQEELKDALNKGNSLNLDDDNYNPHDIATVVKQFFAELPEPIFHQSLYPCYKQVAGKLREMEGDEATPKKIKVLQYLFLLLPPLNRLLLQKLVDLLNIVAHSPSSKMTSHNLGLVFAPNVICSKKFISCLDDYADNMEPLTDVIAFVVEHGLEVFKIPDELMKEYRTMKSESEVDSSQVPMAGSYCRQVDPSEYRKQVQSNTNNALTELYAGVLAMPDGPLKDQFLSKFKKSYPGTPPFIPQKARLKNNIFQSASTQSAGQFSNVRKRTALSPNRADSVDNEVFLTTPEKKRLFQEDEGGNSPAAISRRLSEIRKSPITPSARLRAKLGKLRRSSVGMKALSTLRKLPTPELRTKLSLRVHSSRSKSRVTPVTILNDLGESPSKRRRKSLFASFDVDATPLQPTRVFTKNQQEHSLCAGETRRDTLPSFSSDPTNSATSNEMNFDSVRKSESENTQVDNLAVKCGVPSIRAPLMDLNSLETKRVEFRTFPVSNVESAPLQKIEVVCKKSDQQSDSHRPGNRAGSTPARIHRHPALRVRRTPLKSTEKRITMRDSPRLRSDKQRSARRVTFASCSATPARSPRHLDNAEIGEEAEWQAILQERRMPIEEIENDVEASGSTQRRAPLATFEQSDTPVGGVSGLHGRRVTLDLMQMRRSDADTVPTTKSSDIFDVYTRRLSGSTYEWLQSKHPFLDHAGPPTFL